MKKSLWIALTLMLVCILSFSACDKEDMPPTNDETTSTCQHTFGEWNTTKQATCKEDGELVRICSKCLTEETTTVPKTNTHTYDDNNDKECNICSFIRDIDCKHIDTVTIPAVEPTCVTNGLTEGTKCSLCGETLVSQTIIEPLDHCFTNYVSDGNATYESDGTKTAICDRAGCDATDKKTDVGSKLKELTVQFVAEGNIISTQIFEPSNNNIILPDCPKKDGFVGKWENFVLAETSIVVNAMYIKQEVWDGTSISEGFWDGDGSETAPFTIATPQQLHYFEASVNSGTSYEGKYIKLCANLDLGENEWTPIGYGDGENKNVFKGTFDGSTFSITNYKISESHNKYYYQENAHVYVGLFGCVENATITNLNINKFSINIEEAYHAMNYYINVGGIVGRSLDSAISNCVVDGNINIQKSGYSVSGSSHICRLYVGGIAGLSTGEISNVKVSGEYRGETQYVYAGGISGYSAANIENASFKGDIEANATDIGYAGGIIGNAGNNQISHSFVSAKIHSYGKYDIYCAGIAGIQANVIITDCSATGEFITSRSPGTAYMGGISGYMSSPTDSIDNCFASVMIDIDSTLNNLDFYAGGISGYVKDGSISHSISNGSISILTSYSNAYAYAGGVAGFVKGSSTTDKVKIENCIVDMKLTASNGTSIDVAKIYLAEYCSINNVKSRNEMTNKSDYINLGFKEYIDNGSNNLQNKNLWVWDEASKYMHLNFDDHVSTKYIIKIYLENLDGEYILQETKEIDCISGIFAFPTVEDLEGFVSPTDVSIIVVKDGTSVIEYKYKRENYTIQLIANNGTSTYIYPKYQEKLEGSLLASREGYTLGGWFYDAELTNEANMLQLSYAEDGSLTLYAWWKEENKPSDFEYNVYDSLEYVSINDYIGADNSVVVPSYIQGIPVKQISSYAFKEQTELVSLVIPSTVTTIGTSILQGCNNIVSLTVPFVGKNGTAQYTYLDTNYILGYFFGIQEVKDGLTAPEGWIKQGTVIKSMYQYGVYSNIPSTLSAVTITDATAINAHAFYNCENIKSFVFNDDITIVGECAFYRSGINGALYLPNLQTICEYAFDSTELSYIHLPITVNSIASYAFIGTEGLVISCETSTAKTYWQQDWDYSVSVIYWGVTDNSTELSFFYTDQGYVVDKYNGDAQVIIIPSTYDDGENGVAPVIGVDDYAFYQSNIVAIIIPNTVNYIGAGAFKECDKLVAAILEDGLVNIGEHAFRDCSALQSVDIPATVLTIGERAFQDAGIKTLNIFTNSADMGAWVFYSCNELVNVKIAEGTTKIFHGQFEQCNSIEKIVLPDTVQILDYDAFMNCSALKAMIIPKSVTEIKDWAFHECSETIVIFYDSTEADWRSIIIGTNNDVLYSCLVNTIE